MSRLELLFDPGEPRRHLSFGGRYIGRFGKKASAINLLHQAVTAYREDMGLTTDLIGEDPVNPQVGNFSGDDVADPEVLSNTVNNVVFYLKTLRAPPRRDSSYTPQPVSSDFPPTCMRRMFLCQAEMLQTESSAARTSRT